jgi:hypothetical protein
MRLFTILVMMLALSVSAFAADVDGKWAGTVATPNGDLPVAFTFKADGEKLTGTTMGFDGTDVAITDGKVDKDGKNISFKVTFDFGGMPFELNYKGVVSLTEIKIIGEAAGMPFEFVVKKAPPAAQK